MRRHSSFYQRKFLIWRNNNKKGSHDPNEWKRLVGVSLLRSLHGIQWPCNVLHNDPFPTPTPKEAQLWDCDSRLGRAQDSWPGLLRPWLNARSPNWKSKSVCTQDLQWQEYKDRPLPKGDICSPRKRLQVQVRRSACKRKNVMEWGQEGARWWGTKGRVRTVPATCSRHVKELVPPAFSMGLCLPCSVWFSPRIYLNV